MALRFTGHTKPMTALGALAVILLGVGAWGQGPEGGPPPPPGPGMGGPPFGGPPPGPGMRRPPFGPPPAASVANLPISMLDAELTLTADQKQTIRRIQDRLHRQMRDQMPRPGRPPGGPPDPEMMRASMGRMRGMEQRAKGEIEAVLDSGQKKALPHVLKQANALRKAGIPLEIYGQLRLTTDQKHKIVAIVQEARPKDPALAREGGPFGGRGGAFRDSRRKIHDKVMAVLTQSQKDTLEDFRKTHPFPGPGPGFGPPPGGPRGFGPPPGDPAGFGPPPGGPRGFGPPPGGPGGFGPPGGQEGFGPPPSGDDGPPPGQDTPPPPDEGDSP